MIQFIGDSLGECGFKEYEAFDEPMVRDLQKDKISSGNGSRLSVNISDVFHGVDMHPFEVTDEAVFQKLELLNRKFDSVRRIFKFCPIIVIRNDNEQQYSTDGILIPMESLQHFNKFPLIPILGDV